MPRSARTPVQFFAFPIGGETTAHISAQAGFSNNSPDKSQSERVSTPQKAGPPLNVSIQLLEHHFTGAHAFHLPWFQRAYAWDEEHSAQLLADIVAAMRLEKSHYFLGHVLLAGTTSEPRLALIDGHQRTLTLTILFALLRDRAPTPEDSIRVERLIDAAGFSEVGIPGVSGFRVQPQPAIAEFFATYIQQPGGTKLDAQDHEERLLEIEQGIIKNRTRLGSLLDEFTRTPEQWHQLTNFLLQSCYFVVEHVDDQDEAWAMLALEESTGLPFHSAERLKISLISTVPRESQKDASQKWGHWQSQLGRDDLLLLMHHIRSLLLGRRSNQPIEQDLIKRLSTDGYNELFDNHIEPNVRHFLDLKQRSVGNLHQRKTIARALDTLQWLERDFWVAPALKWLNVNGSGHPETAEFFTQLERLSWLLRISSNDPIQHERHFLRLCREITPDAPLMSLSALVVTSEMHTGTLNNLLSRTFFEKKYSRLILRRISIELGADPGEIDGQSATIEHILPRRPDKDSAWRKILKDKNTIRNSVHRLGNLAILTLEHNQKAGVQLFDKKRPILKQSKFALAKQAATYSEWSPDTIEHRSRTLINILLAAWQLPLEPTSEHHPTGQPTGQ